MPLILVLYLIDLSRLLSLINFLQIYHFCTVGRIQHVHKQDLFILNLLLVLLYA